MPQNQIPHLSRSCSLLFPSRPSLVSPSPPSSPSLSLPSNAALPLSAFSLSLRSCVSFSNPLVSSFPRTFLHKTSIKLLEGGVFSIFADRFFNGSSPLATLSRQHWSNASRAGFLWKTVTPSLPTLGPESNAAGIGRWEFVVCEAATSP